ncbi:hypothetical protein RHMOL_Rhmol10G0246000 [Rhododendron molle]|uniref:Uncharacterized protein n=1 Tax=Rhododendron molle TaxID=49168 RepID=A0ACC0M5J9_RHOML|nr:hypothetical protein RHMOL_Rhmol10G0246000 [Rhododendron molle]
MDSQVNPPRWTPSQSPTRTLLANIPIEPEIHFQDQETEGVASLGSYHDDSLPFSNSKFNFPLSNGPTSQHVGPPARTMSHPPRPRAPVYIGGVEDPVVMEIIRSMEVERVPVEKQVQQRRDEYHVDCFNQNHGGGGGSRGGAVGLKGNEIFLTWKDLWVTVPDKKGGRRAILQGVTGYVEPGEVLPIMGPSGCGKSTLLDTLAENFFDHISELGFTRQVSWCMLLCRTERVTSAVLDLRRALAYVTQDDTLLTTLTVKEAVYYSAELQLPDSMSRSEKRERADVTIRDMGLQDSINTRIGGWSSKGLSGGQKRRVSICVEILTRLKLLFLDEPTSGLDSAASFHVMDRIIKLAKQEQRTMVASIHQPSSEVFELFHNLCLLSSGRTIYFGSTSAADEFFTFSGFPCPPLRNPSDHYLRTVNKDFDVARLGGKKMSAVEAINTLVKSYNSSEAYRQVQQRVFEICQQARGSMLMFVTLVSTFMAIGGFPSFVEDMKIFTRERLNGHYGVCAFVVGNTFSSLPYLFLIAVIPGAIAYYLVGLQKGIDHFAYFVVLLYACMLLVESLMMIVASVVPNFLMGIITGAGIQGVMMLNGGFFRLPNDLPKPFRYSMYYIAFHKYANQGLFKNEFKGLKFPKNLAIGPQTITGDEILRNIWQVEMGYSKCVDVAVILGMVVLYRLMFSGIIKTVEKVKPILTKLMAGSAKKPTLVEDSYTTSPAT